MQTQPHLSPIECANTFVYVFFPSNNADTTTCGSSTAGNLMNNVCDGNMECTLHATAAFLGPDPCSSISKYINVSHTCLPGMYNNNICIYIEFFLHNKC